MKNTIEIEIETESKNMFIDMLKLYNFESVDKNETIWIYENEEDTIEIVWIDMDKFYVRFEANCRGDIETTRRFMSRIEVEDFVDEYFDLYNF